MPPMRITEDIQPLTTFRNHSVEILRHLKKTQRPLVLTVHGKPEAVMLDAGAYQRLMDVLAQADEDEAIRQCEEDIRHGRTTPAREALAEIRRASGLSR
jgi:prevent-host-death family protein